MVDRTYLPFWKASIATHLMAEELREDYLDAEIGRARSERVRQRLVALKSCMMTEPRRREGRVVSLRRRRP